jgi:hypothetical protein
MRSTESESCQSLITPSRADCSPKGVDRPAPYPRVGTRPICQHRLAEGFGWCWSGSAGHAAGVVVEAAEQSSKQVKRSIVGKAFQSVKAKEAVFPRTGRAARGGRRRGGETGESQLIRSLIETYCDVRRRYCDGSQAVSCDGALRGFVRAGLKFAVAVEPFIGGGDMKFAPPDMVTLDRPNRISDQAIRGVFDRLPAQTRKKIARS